MAKSPFASASALLAHYGFDLHGLNLDQIVYGWLGNYPAKWVIAAVVEALYQGRYKAASVNSILSLWCLRGQPVHHFDYEFADIVCSQLFRTLPPHPTALEQNS